jgi:hypothetical protein
VVRALTTTHPLKVHKASGNGREALKITRFLGHLGLVLISHKAISHDGKPVSPITIANR